MVNRIIAAIISFTLPGIGHMIQGQYRYGFIIFILTLLTFYVVDIFAPVFIAELVWIIIGLLAAYSTYQMPET